MLSATAAYECVCLLLELFVVEQVCSTLVKNWLQSKGCIGKHKCHVKNIHLVEGCNFGANCG